MVVDTGILHQGPFQILAAAEAGGFEDLGDPTVETFDHAVGLRVFGWDEAVLDAMALAGLVEKVTAGRFAFPGGAEAVGELLTPSLGFAPSGPAARSKSAPGGFVFAVVGQDLGDFEGSLGDQAVEEGGGDLGFLGGMDFQVDPATGPVDGDEEVTAPSLIGHLGQVLDVDVDKPGLVVLEAFLFGLGGGVLPFLGSDQFLEIGDPMAAQQPVQSRAGHLGMDEAVNDRQQVVQGQQQGFAQTDHDRFLLRGQGGMDAMGPVRGVLDRIALAPLADGMTMNAVFPGQDRGRQIGVLDLPADLRGGAGFLVKTDDHNFLLVRQA
ncbi:hypothetical protein MIT9_P0928 [Methylomarinovum caldicuralii]|uniref:Uncharacterized protein n=1 Tax=Methylomarinovum caldicuralii TaxID=438856 RepID=A0AAU9CED6_9GAMM|nr:hypothetical protein MIT9_P0928 [Methylomarinovum caldicuralii]